MVDSPDRVTCVVLAYGDEPLLKECVESLLGSTQVCVDVVLVDNGCANPDLASLAQLRGVTLLRPSRNTGFAGGANLGAAAATGAYLAFVNSDAIVAPATLHEFAVALRDVEVGIATACVRLLDQPDLINSCGNPVHYTGISWAGGMGLPAENFAHPVEVASASGAAMACTASTWSRLGGFCEEMFAYHEDTDLSLRCWQAGLKVCYVPSAVVFHKYEFSRNPLKLGLLERNRLILVLTLYERRSLLILSPALLAMDLAVLALSVRHGWWRHKVNGWAWLIQNRKWLVERRGWVQARRRMPDSEMFTRSTADLDPGHLGPAIGRTATILSRAYWVAARVGLQRGQRFI